MLNTLRFPAVSIATCAAAIVLAVGRTEAAEPREVLPHHVPQAVTESRQVGPMPRAA
jgi:hypothetical protein